MATIIIVSIVSFFCGYLLCGILAVTGVAELHEECNFYKHEAQRMQEEKNSAQHYYKLGILSAKEGEFQDRAEGLK